MTITTMNDPIPVVTDVSHIYPPDDLPRQKERYANLIHLFTQKYHGPPSFVARSPGRVNIIGEHIDYSLYEVLPMAIAADVLIAVSTQGSKRDSATISLANVDSTKFKSSDINISSHGDVSIDASTLDWANYFKSGYRGAVELLKSKDANFVPSDLQILVDGNVPAGGGLSSSAAFVCASALAVLRAHGLENVTKKELVELAIVSERAVGVNSGGMDQAASVFSVRGDAVSVKFWPQLNAEAIAFPKVNPPMTFLIAQSFVSADKHVAAPKQYNLRVVECSLAAEVLAAKMGVRLPDDSSPLGRSIRGLQDAYFKHKDAGELSEEERLKQLLTLVEEKLPSSDGYTREDIASVLSISVPELEHKFMSKFEVQAERFLLRQRTQHVLTEALRVLSFKSLLTSSSDSDLLTRLGALMDKTQSSCRDVYECSCPEIDKLCAIAKDAGSYGSRLTGAGWGGCTVHLVPKDKVSTIKAAWDTAYYQDRDPSWTSERSVEKGAVVASEPGHGSMVLLVDG